MSILSRVLSPARRAWLSDPKHDRFVVAFSLVLALGALGNGLLLDDYVHRLVVTQQGNDVFAKHDGLLDLFRFADDDPANTAFALETGWAPWYTGDALRLSFFRPLSSLTHTVDYALIGKWPWAMHLHSLLWLALLGFAVTRLVRELTPSAAPTAVAGLVIWFYVLDGGHGTPAGWLANRNVLLAGTFGALALRAHVWSRQDSGRCEDRFASAIWFALALASADAAIGWLGFFIAYAVTLDPAGRRRGARALWPFVVLVIGWRALVTALGYGVAHSGLYIDPLRDPLRFATATLERLPQLLAGQLAGIPTGITGLSSTEVQLAGAAVCAVAVLVLLALFAKPLREDRVMRFYAVGGLLAAIPSCATMPHARLMTIAGLGTAGVAAHYIFATSESESRVRRFAAVALLVICGVLGPLKMPIEVNGTRVIGRPMELALASVQELPSVPLGSLDQRVLVVVAVPEPMFMCGQVHVARRAMSLVGPSKTRCLAKVEERATITRVDADTLEIHAEEGLLSGFLAPLVRDEPMRADFSRRLSDLTITVDDIVDGDPRTVRVRFDEITSPRYEWVAWDKDADALVPFTLPAVGEQVTVEGEPVENVMLGS